MPDVKNLEEVPFGEAIPQGPKEPDFFNNKKTSLQANFKRFAKAKK